MDKENFTRLRGELFCDHPLARYTSWRVGGKAERFYRPADLFDLQDFLTQLPSDEPLTWLGLGSNVLIRDGGIKGTVILTLNRLKELSVVNSQLVFREKSGTEDFFSGNGKTIIRAEAGVTCAKLAKFCVSQGLEDGAFFAGIPGTVGGALAMNAGAFGGETWRTVIGVETMNHQGEILKRTPDEFKIHYRQVEGLENQFFIAGYFCFNHGDPDKAKTAINALLKKRNLSQPIGKYSCGSVFRNPPGDYAARLIESAGLKGKSIGNAEVSEKHANFILNKGNASAADIEALIHYVAQHVSQNHGIQLVKEVHIIGRS
ncbi:UDP-N-acetylenolpyruvoylglucosamine reductase [Coxiella burnetii]|uniref:UDP-N-acetylenolpyruvoylglucosamine reductase n=1 Tax=Coxiella burnetii (strain Dugway 5J108-111) TaxID=434922 RepID=MURB_COXBN|nr:UDP-N-acetylmuramate dehydrogenase [Coxiella burnetii]A9KER1.1 RecName: Full=UDP-N-acetylenolpyruvoylglucosamine reductase; AltName: Full=UDP-N-acetylmuramate dehydrogenase [Coxiella burnetii Dugway 5J108-111]ABS78102.1 UDP-N-acetylenolpyruvoylglucosamine reductase [Coxiella burnetii Dugway 5J108-111]OYK79445.1 UDP-N-acetylenolpyruvoylglucosamine reductase [Coxiella burnetii]OYK81526.1 UDP-N-acetylenolpyruvoylglucosamine reductase [Coxiella burnetii]